jgi:hypothetical protein
MSKGFKGQGAYSTDRGDASAFKPDTSFFKNPLRGGEGETAGKRPKLKGWNMTKGGFGSADNSAVDPSLKYSGGNEGYEGGDS